METCITVWPTPKHPRWYDEGMRESLGLIREAGFTHVNFTTDGGSSYMFSGPEINFTARMIHDAGLKVKSLHASNGRNGILEVSSRQDRTPVMETRRDIGSPHEWQRLSGIELVQNRVALAAALGSPDAILHIEIDDTVFRSPETEAAFFDPFWYSLDALEPFCRAHGVKIAVENLLGASADSWVLLFDRLFQRYDASFIGMCFDTGHWFAAAGPGDMTLLDRHGDRLIATHVHDNFGVMDEHLLPFDGRIDWPIYMKAIAGTACEMPLNLETPPDRHNLPESAFFKRAHRAAVQLETMVLVERGRKT
ncbi:MAG: Xylose isomerase-like TIM barrel [Rhodobacteraceae bacterium HLUCCA08]|nr:MAG: Xylose isomerase-like TIM barrel [Rhodobacteraceae bacterium HLUCCA08]